LSIPKVGTQCQVQQDGQLRDAAVRHISKGLPINATDLVKWR